MNALKHNFESIKRLAGDCRLMPVVKADAYGHSAKDIALALQAMNADAFAVSNLNEACVLRENGIKAPILILGYTPPEAAEELVKYDIIQSVFSAEYAKALSCQAQLCGKKIKIHIKLDTGMGRIGFDCRDRRLNGISDAIAAAGMDGFIFDGIFTHFAHSDRITEDGFTDEQYRLFSKAVKQFCDAGMKPQTVHCCNSAALCRDTDKHSDICRVGIILYGLTPAEGFELPFEPIPVMTVKSVVSMVKDIRPGDSVSYGRTFKAQKNMRIATVSAGYADGYPRLLSNRGEVIIGGKRAKIVGRICMDQFSVDVTHIPQVKAGDEVILLGKELPAEELARLCGTINYEIVCGFSARVPRIVIK